MQAVRESLESDLPPEPPEKCDQPITTIKIRSPDGASFCRRFLASDRLQVPTGPTRGGTGLDPRAPGLVLDTGRDEAASGSIGAYP